MQFAPTVDELDPWLNADHVLCPSTLNRSLDVDRATHFGEEALVQDLVMTSFDANEGVNSFKERRPTEFKGW